MKQSTLQDFARNQHHDYGNAWKHLDAIARESGDDKAAAKKAVHDFVVALALSRSIQYYFENRESVEREIRKTLSDLNEQYPFDVASANQRVKQLFTQYLELMVGLNGYPAINTLVGVLDRISSESESETTITNVTKATSDAWDYL